MDIIEETTIERDGITYRVILAPDSGSSPDDSECYSDAAKAAFRAGEWEYIGIIVRPVIDGQGVGDAEDSLWGVEYGTLPGHVNEGAGDDELTHDPVRIDMRSLVESYPVPGMVSEARGNLAKVAGSLRSLADAISGMSLDDCTAYNPHERRDPNVVNAYCLRAAGHDPKHRDLDGREW